MDVPGSKLHIVTRTTAHSTTASSVVDRPAHALPRRSLCLETRGGDERGRRPVTRVSERAVTSTTKTGAGVSGTTVGERATEAGGESGSLL